MSIFSRLRKRDSDDPAAPEAGAGAKAPADSPPAKPADGKAPASREEQPKAASKAAPVGATRTYAAAKPAAARPAASPAPARNAPPTAPAAAARSSAAQGEDDDKQVKGAASIGAAVAKAAAANGRLAANGVPATAAPGAERRSVQSAGAAAPPVAPARSTDEAAPDQALSAPGSIDLAFEAALLPPGAEPPAAKRAEGTSTAADRKAMLATFEELAVGHTAPLRSFMLEVRWGEAQTSWIALARPALKSLRAMASQVEHAALPGAIDAFDAALAELLRPGAPSVVQAASREALLAAYAPLIAAMPRAFELEGERDRREPVVVRALLEQVPGLEPLIAERMIAAGLGRLEALYQAKADEIAVVADVPAEVAAATVELVQAFRRATPAALAAPDAGAAARELRALVGELGEDHRRFEAAARGWTEADREAKKRTRRKRDVDFARVTIALARLGEVDLALRLAKVPFQRRVEELAALAGRLAATAPAEDRVEIEKRTDSGAPAAP
ncbi:MAG TPA: hypothetical protein VKZ18_12030 [Polyangia bacterium]|nr:hypothetical protein [Polyangia bacterium]